MNDESSIIGGCLCGAARYEAAGKARNVTHCHCSDCRKSSGAPLVTWATFDRRGFRFTRGQPREFPWAGRLRGFCSECGTPLTFMAGAASEEIDVTVCSFDDPTLVIPEDHTWVEDRVPWMQWQDGLPQYAQARIGHGTA